MNANAVCPLDCDCAGCECPACGADDFIQRSADEVIMEEVLKPLLDFYRCKCKHEWGVYK